MNQINDDWIMEVMDELGIPRNGADSKNIQDLIKVRFIRDLNIAVGILYDRHKLLSERDKTHIVGVYFKQFTKKMIETIQGLKKESVM